MSILRLLGLEKKANGGAEAQEPPELARLRAAVEGLEPAKARYVTAFAMILGRVASADNVVTEEEVAAMRKIVSDETGLASEQVELIVELARSRHLLEDTADYLITSEFRRIAIREQKMALLNCLFSVAAAEAEISSVEEEMIRQISVEINLSDRDFVAVRYRYLKHLAAFRARRVFHER